MDLVAAVKANNLERVRLLVEQGADEDEGDFDLSGGRLVKATYCCRNIWWSKERPWIRPPTGAALLSSLLQPMTILRYAQNDGYTPLHSAAANGYLEIAMLLMSYGADLNARNNYGNLPIDLAITVEIKQAIRDEPRRRIDEAPGKRATEQDRHPTTATSASAQQEDEEENDEQKCKLSGSATENEAKDEDSEPSDGEHVD